MADRSLNQCGRQVLRLEVLYECIGPADHEGGCFMDIVPTSLDSTTTGEH